MADRLISQLGVRPAVLTTDLMVLEPAAGPPAEQADIAKLITLLDTIYAPITGGAYVLKAGDMMTGLLTIAQATANTSAMAVTGYSLTGANAQSLLSLAGTWNTTGGPKGIDLNITNTASDATATRLLDLRVGGVSKCSVTLGGRIFCDMVGFSVCAQLPPKHSVSIAPSRTPAITNGWPCRRQRVRSSWQRKRLGPGQMTLIWC